jgi:hypothetical protein
MNSAAQIALPKRPGAVVACAGGFVVLAALAYLLRTGSPLIAAAVVSIVALPFFLYAALVRPMIFPFGLYVLLIPFDNLLGTGSGATLTKFIGIVAGVCLLIWTARTRRVLVPARSGLALCVFLTWAGASVLWALDQGTALQVLPTYAGLTILYAALSMSPVTFGQYRLLLVLSVVGALAAALYGTNSLYHDPALRAGAGVARLVVHIGNRTIDPNQFADSMLFPAAAVLMYALRSGSLVAKVAGLAGLGVFTECILLSGSREALLGLVLILLYYAWRSRYRLQITIAGLIAAAIALSVQTSLWERFATAISTGGSGRTSIWSVGLEAAKHSWLAGYGIGNFANAYDIFYINVYQHYPYGFSSPAHNIVMHYLVELGIIGLLLLGWFFWEQFASIRIVHKLHPLYDYRLMLEASLASILFVALSIDLFTYKYAWLVFSLVALLRNLAVEAHKAAMREDSSSMIASRS